MAVPAVLVAPALKTIKLDVQIRPVFADLITYAIVYACQAYIIVSSTHVASYICTLL